MKKVICILLALCMCLFLMAGCGNEPVAPSSPAEDPSAAPGNSPAVEPSVSLVLADGNPIGSQRYNQLSLFLDHITDLSGGDIGVEFYAAGVLMNDRDALEGLMNDTASFAFINPGNASATVPDVAIMSMPGTYFYSGSEDAETLIEFEAAIHDKMVEIYEGYGIRYLTLFPPTETAILCTDEAIVSPEQCDGYVFRTSGTFLGQLMENWGLATTTIVVSDVATALDKGTVEGLVTGCDVATMWSWYELADYITVLPYCDTLGALCMSMDSWNSLTPDQQAIIEEAAAAFLKDALQMKLDFQQTCYDKWEEQGVTVNILSEEEAAAFLGEHYTPVEDGIKANCTEKGLELIDIIKQWQNSK